MFTFFTSSFESFVFTRTAAGHILGGVCQRLEVWSNCVWAIVLVAGKKLVRFISKRRFFQFFAESRKQRSYGIPVTQNAFDTFKFTARSSRGDELYHLETLRGGITCTCDDFKNQMSLFGDRKKLCKHGYAVLNRLGYGSLQQYLDDQHPF